MRLTNDLRRKIRDVLIERAFGERTKELKTLKAAWNKTVQDFLLPAALKAKMATLPPRSFPSDDDARIKIDGEILYINWEKKVEMPYDMACHSVTEIPSQHPLAIEHHQLTMLKKALDEQQSEAMRAAWAALEAVTTSGALIKRWPEVEPFLNTIIGEEQSKTLVIPIRDLNRKLGLGDNPLPAAKPIKTARVKRRSAKA